MSLLLETKRLILRDYVPSDWKDVHEYSADSEVVQFMIWGPNSEEQTQDFVKRMMESQREDPRTKYEVAVSLKDTGKVIGGIGVRVNKEHRNEADLGYCYSRQTWGKGYGGEAAQAMLKFGFEELALHRIWATCDPNNIGSSRVLEKIGMRLEGHFKQNTFIKGNWQDTLLYAILENEFVANKKQVDSCNTA